MKELKRLEKKEFEEILSERGCAFIKNGLFTTTWIYIM